MTTVFFLQKGKPSRQSSLEEKRKYVVAELLETERGYVQALQMIEEVSTLTVAAVAFEEMHTLSASGQEMCVQKFGNVYQRKETEKQMTHFKGLLLPSSSNDSGK